MVDSRAVVSFTTWQEFPADNLSGRLHEYFAIFLAKVVVVIATLQVEPFNFALKLP